MARDLINKICVRTHINIDGERVNQGSGILIKDGEEFFVITAQHCIYGNQGQYKGISKENILIEYQDTYNSSFKRILVEEIIKDNKRNDWILFKVKDPNIEAIQIVKAKNFPKKTYVEFRGYQNRNPDEFRPFPAKIITTSKEKFRIHLTEVTLDQGGEQGSDIAKGLSGSGVYIEDKGKVYLLGIVKSVVGELALNNDIDCTPICLLDEMMSEESRDFYDLVLSNKRSIPIKEELKIINKDFEPQTSFEVDKSKVNIGFAEKYIHAENSFYDLLKPIFEHKYKITRDIGIGKNEINIALRSPLNMYNDILFEIQFSEARVGGDYFYNSLNKLKSNLEYYKDNIKQNAIGRLIFLMTYHSLHISSKNPNTILSSKSIDLIKNESSKLNDPDINATYFDLDRIESYSKEEVFNKLKL